MVSASRRAGRGQRRERQRLRARDRAPERRRRPARRAQRGKRACTPTWTASSMSPVRRRACPAKARAWNIRAMAKAVKRRSSFATASS
eukprot:14772837-Alexandrium_andersonii.AAC.1